MRTSEWKGPVRIDPGLPWIRCPFRFHRKCPTWRSSTSPTCSERGARLLLAKKLKQHFKNDLGKLKLKHDFKYGKNVV